MSHVAIKQFFLMGSLLVVLVLSAAFTSQAQDNKHHDDCTATHPCDDPHPMPEPLTMLLLATGLVGTGAVARMRKRREV